MLQSGRSALTKRFNCGIHDAQVMVVLPQLAKQHIPVKVGAGNLALQVCDLPGHEASIVTAICLT